MTSCSGKLGTGMKSEDYGGLGLERGMSVALRSQIAALDSYDNTITQIGTRLDLSQQVLGRIGTIGSTLKSSAQSSLFSPSDGQTIAQTTAATNLDEILGLLNTQAGNRYLFSGKATDTPATVSTDQILNGDGTRAGFKQVMAERLQADLGSNGLGRLVTAAAGTTVSTAEDAAGSPFGFKIAGMTTTIAGATINAPAGSPPSESIDLAGSTPAAGQTVSLKLSLPDGTSTTLTLTATTASPPGDNTFTIGASPAATAGNLNAAIGAALQTLGKTTLTPASAMAAANDFFNVDAGHSPQRVAGPPFDSATALVDGTATDTVTWYSGEADSDPARSTAVARIDPSMSIAYGVRANEQGITSILKAVAVFATVSFSPTDPSASDSYGQLHQRVSAALAGAPGQQQIADIQAELGNAQAAAGAAKDRHAQAQGTATDLLQRIEGVSQEEVGAKLLALQTSLEASLQTTAMMFKTTILNYI